MIFRLRRWALSALCVGSLFALLPGCTKRSMPPLEPPMTVRRADEAFHFGDYASAVEYYKAYLDRTWQGEYTAISAFQCALAEYRLKHYQATIATLNDLQKRYPDHEWAQVQALRGDAERALGNDTLALLEWDEGWDAGSEADQSKLRLRIVTLARGMPPDKLAQARTLVVHEDVRELLSPGGGRSAPEINAPMPEDDYAPVAAAPVVAPHRAAKQTEPQLAAAQADKLDVGSEDEPLPPLEDAPLEADTGAPVGASAARPPDANSAGTNAAERAFAQGKKSDTPKQGRGAAAPPPLPVVESDDEELVMAERSAAEPSAFAAVPPSDGAVPSPGARIGVLLPMSGRNSDLGPRAWQALQLAFGDDASRLLLKDTGGDAATTRRVLNELWRDPQVVAVIGPVTGADAAAVAQLAEQDELPLLALSQDDSIGGRYVLQMGMTRAELVGSLLDYAVNKARLQRFGVLYPDDENGRAFLAAFRSAADQRGGTIVGTVAYRPGGDVVPRYGDTLFQWRQKADLEALFLADTSATAARVATFLQGEMPDVTLLGVQGWAPLAGEVGLNGVLFADGFFAGSSRLATREFVQRFQETYGQTPGGLEARAHDAGILAKRALDAGAGTRSQMMTELRALGSVDGATGNLRVTPSGLQRSVFLLRVYKGTLEEVGAVG